MEHRKQIFDPEGIPLVGGRLYVTNETFVDSGYSVRATDPIVLDAEGKAVFYTINPLVVLRVTDMGGKELMLEKERAFEHIRTVGVDSSGNTQHVEWRDDQGRRCTSWVNKAEFARMLRATETADDAP